MAKREKRLKKIKNNPKNVSSDDLISCLLSYGFEEKGGSGSHRCYKHPEDNQGRKLTVPKQYPLMKTYVIQAINVLDDLLG